MNNIIKNINIKKLSKLAVVLIGIALLFVSGFQLNSSGEGQPLGIITVSVEQLTTNHLPNITGTCTVGGNMVFTIKKGNTGVISEVINKFCDVSPYSLNPTIPLPDGKYRVDATINEYVDYPTCVDILGTPNNDTITGNIPDYNYDCIYGGDGNDNIYTNGGDDVISGENGNDSLSVGTNSGALGGRATLIGGLGNDTLTGGTEISYLVGCSLGSLNPEQDIIIGGSGVDRIGLAPGNICYNEFGDQDYATILNFNPLADTIINFGIPSQYTVTYTNGFTSLYFIDYFDGSLDLVAKIESSTILDLNASYFETY